MRSDLELQLDWDAGHLEGKWPRGPDHLHVVERVLRLLPDVVAAGTPGRVLEVAAAEAIHSRRLARRGLRAFVLDPSAAMLAKAREASEREGAHFASIRGVAEALPFRDQTFDRVLIDSAIDHVADPQAAIREMTRVLTPDGRLVVSIVNYDGLGVRLSRLLYRIARRTGLAAPTARLFWDTPVPLEHTFECTQEILARLCGPYLALESARGISIGWMVPGWGRFLAALPSPLAAALLGGIDRLAERAPRRADLVVSVWRPRDPSSAKPTIAPAAELLYRSHARAEADFWTRTEFGAGFATLTRPVDRLQNTIETGDPGRPWIDDVMARGPFERAAVLGCDELGYERRWLERGGSKHLDVYELSPGVIRKVRRGLGPLSRRARFIEADLNFARLPAAGYDVVWSSGCLHHVIDLEHLLDEVAQALKPGGLFAIRDYVGERRMQFARERLARANAVLREVPARYRRIDAIVPPRPNGLSPFCAVRSDDVVALAKARFEVVHEARSGALFPLFLALDLDALEREAPEVLARVCASEEAALRDANAAACGTYLVLRARARAHAQ